MPGPPLLFLLLLIAIAYLSIRLVFSRKFIDAREFIIKEQNLLLQATIMENFNLPQETFNDSSALCDFLKTVEVDDETVEILKNEKVTGQTFIEINESDLKEMDIKLGPRKRLLQIIRTATQTPTNNEPFQTEPEIVIVSSPSISVDRVPLQPLNYQDNSEINVRKWVISHAQGQDLAQKLDAETYTVHDRQLLVRIVCANMMKICGSAYPSAFMKLKVAEDIVSAFPGLKSKNFAKGHESFYDETTCQGFIEYRLKTIRKSLDPCDKRRSSPKQSTAKKQRISNEENLLDEDNLEEKVQWMQLKKPTEANRRGIEEALNETMSNRHCEILDAKLTVTDILKRYPRLQDYKGDMIDKEFSSRYPNCDSFLGKFSAFYVPRIIQYIETYRPDLLGNVNDLDDPFKALILLPELLPSPNYGKGKGKKGQGKTCNLTSQKAEKRRIPCEELIVFLNGNEDIVNYSNKDNTESVQPFLICPMKDGSRRNCSFFIKVDNILIDVEDHAIKAFDILFKLHFVFNVKYARKLENFYDFMAGCIYRISKPRSCCDALHTCIYNIPVDVNKIIHY